MCLVYVFVLDCLFNDIWLMFKLVWLFGNEMIDLNYESIM